MITSIIQFIIIMNLNQKEETKIEQLKKIKNQQKTLTEGDARSSKFSYLN